MGRRVRMCRRCHRHPAKFSHRGVVKADDDHDMCFQCFRSECNRRRRK